MHKLGKLLSKDSSIIALFLVLGIGGLILFHLKQESIFPNASIDLSISKPETLKLAKQWATRLGYQKQDVIESIVFDGDDQSKTFLEYELGNAEANRLMRDTVPIFFWQCRFRKSLDQETMDVQISPTGKLLAIDFQLPNDKKLPSIEHAEAEKKAFAFIKEQIGWEQKDCKLTEDETKPQVNRTDHKFTWESEKLDWHGAKLRADVELSGNMLTNFNYYLKRPEKWDRDYSTIRTKNQLLESIASVFYFALYPIGIFLFLRGMSKGNIRLRFAVITGVALTSIFALEYLNNFPDVLSTYSPSTSYKLFILSSVVYPLLSVPFLIMFIAALAGGAELVYREMFPEKIALERILTAGGIRSKETLVGLVIGIAAFGLSLGYQIIYYSLGTRFHFWCPLEVGNYQVLSAYWPWFSALSLGVFAATNEEILYRVLMLGLTKKVVGNFWLANILQAAAWGFMHSTYPQQPCYVRGLELTIEGVFDGWLLRRFGLVACLVSHYSFDAFQCITPLLSAPLKVSLSASIPFLPLLLVLAYSLKKHQAQKSQADQEPSLLNKDVDQPLFPQNRIEQEKSDSPIPFTYDPLSNKIRWLLVSLAVIGLLVRVTSGNKCYSIGEDGETLNVTRTQAVEKVQQYLSSIHLDTTDYMIATVLYGNTVEDRDQLQYLFEQLGLQRTNAIVKEINRTYDWVVRLVKPLTPAEYSCTVDADGKIKNASIKLGEDAPGACLKKADAQAIAEKFLRTYRSVYVPFELDGATEIKRKKRVDHHFIFRVPKYKVGEADLKVGLDVLGDIPANANHYWDLPDKWQWERTKRSTRREVAAIISALAGAVASIAGIIWAVSLFKADKIRWRYPLILAGLFCLSSIVYGVDGLPMFFMSYQSTVPLNTWFAIFGIGSMVAMLFGWGALSLSIAIILAGNTEQIKLRLKNTLSTFIHGPKRAFSSKSYRQLYLDAVIFACAMQGLSFLQASVKGAVNLALKHEVSLAAAPGAVTALANLYVAPLQVLMSLAVSLLAAPLLVGLAVALCKLLRLTSYWRFLAAVCLIQVVSGLGDRYWQDFFGRLNLQCCHRDWTLVCGYVGAKTQHIGTVHCGLVAFKLCLGD